MRIDIGDLLLLLGAVMVLVGLCLFDWRYALIAAGVMVMGLGMARLRMVANYDRNETGV